ncbi:MAG: alcohol dehydrogenase catalytic domain-containing protein [Erysipelotrichaceae bacterium]|nr:alcohol dehydrogenase catalytic domain-containing protein [Erysipelotrichaceae bacterium]
MKQAIYYGTKDVKIIENAIPEISDNDVLVKNLCSAICGTDVFAYYHSGAFARINPGDEFGHEMISEVVKVGKNIDSVKVGQRLYPFPIMAKANPARSGTVGGYSEYIVLPSFRLGVSAFLVDDSISDEAGCLIEPLTVGCHAAKIARPSNEKNAIVFGAGMVGMASALGLNKLGIKDVIITDISEKRLKIASELGFKTCNVANENLVEYAKEVFGDFRGKINCDIFVDAAGVKSNLDLFLDNAKFGATLSIPSVYHSKYEIDLMKVTFGQFNIIGSPAYDMEDVKIVMEMLKEYGKDVTKLITHSYTLENIEEAFAQASNAKESLKVIIDYR